MRILRLTPHFYRQGSWPVAFDPVGGLQIQVWTLAREIDRAGIAQTVVTSFIPGAPRKQVLFDAAELVSAGLRLPRRLAGALLCFFWFLGCLPRLLGGGSRYDLVHIHFNHSFWCRVLAIIAGWTAMPVAVSMNTVLWGGLQRALRLEGSRFDLTCWIEGFALRAADRVVALTEGAAMAAVGKFGVDPKRLATIPDAVDAAIFGPAVEQDRIDAFRKRFGIPEGAGVVAYVGRISAEKGWRDLPPLARELSRDGAFLLVCGDGPDRAGLERALLRQGLNHNWAVTGFLPPSEIRIAMQAADLLVLPTRQEVFGSVLLEAMASGLPAVSYAVGGVVDVAGEPAAISLVPAGEREAFLNNARLLLADPAARQALATRGRERVKQFSIEASVALTLALYERMAPAATAGPTSKILSAA